MKGQGWELESLKEFTETTDGRDRVGEDECTVFGMV
jgi:hypothetical protein